MGPLISGKSRLARWCEISWMSKDHYLQSHWFSRTSQPLVPAHYYMFNLFPIKDHRACLISVSNVFYFHPYLGKRSNLTSLFQLGWNHQLDFEWCWIRIHRFQKFGVCPSLRGKFRWIFARFILCCCTVKKAFDVFMYINLPDSTENNLQFFFLQNSENLIANWIWVFPKIGGVFPQNGWWK